MFRDCIIDGLVSVKEPVLPALPDQGTENREDKSTLLPVSKGRYAISYGKGQERLQI